MRKLTTSLNPLIVLFLTITLFSCSSDDDNVLGQNDYSNKIDFDGQTYEISSGILKTEATMSTLWHYSQ